MRNEFGINLPNDLRAIKLGSTARINFRARLSSSGDGLRRARKLKEALGRAPNEFAIILDRILREAINAGIWRLRNGGAGDIIDSGRLLGSQRVTSNGSSIQISYGVPYAALIHYGGYIVPYGDKRQRPIYIPGRPWVATVLGSQFGGYDINQIYIDIIKRIISSI